MEIKASRKRYVCHPVEEERRDRGLEKASRPPPGVNADILNSPTKQVPDRDTLHSRGAVKTKQKI